MFLHSLIAVLHVDKVEEKQSRQQSRLKKKKKESQAHGPIPVTPKVITIQVSP
jgi:hypothetical protein